MRSSVAKIVALLVALGTVSGTAANAADASVTLDPTRRSPPRTLGNTPATPRAVANPGWPKRIDTRIQALHDGRPDRETDPTRPDAELAQSLLGIAASAGSATTVGIAVADVESGDMLVDLHGDALLNPASNLKLLTAAAAVELLGADFRFETRIARAGQDLIIVGSGDPSLQLEHLVDIAEAIPTQDLVGVERIVVDDSAFSNRRFGPGYDPDGPGFSYQAPSGALSLQFNTVEVRVRPGARGEPAHVSTRPACEHIAVASSATTSRGRAIAVSTREDAGRTLVAVRGAIAPGAPTFRIRRRITDPGRFTGTALAKQLARRLGRSPVPVVRGQLPAGATVVHVHRSAALVDVLGSALKFSNNFTTEQLLRTLGHLATGRPGDWRNGSAVIRRFWRALGLPDDELVFVNGSGLGRQGRITPRALVSLLAVVSGAHTNASMVDAMAVAGREGTVAKRLRHTQGRVRAKTGTLRGASGLTGVISGSDGSPQLAFSVLVNGHMGTSAARRLQDRVVRKLVARQN